MKVKVKNEDALAVKAYLAYIVHLEKKEGKDIRKDLLNDFLRRHVQDIHFDPFVSVEAVKELKRQKIPPSAIENIKWPFKDCSSYVEKIGKKHLFTNRSPDKIFHFEHNIPAGQAAEMLLALDLKAPDIDDSIKKILSLCTLCLITLCEDKKLNKKWKNERPEDAYKQLGIELMPLSEACSQI